MFVSFSLELESGNAAFSDNPRGEIQRAVTEATAKVLAAVDYSGDVADVTIRDVNGNRIGGAMCSIEESE